DGLGRTTRFTDADGNISYTVYNDGSHETRTYSGWTGSTTTGPIVINREFWPSAGAPSGQRTVYDEAITSSATPTVTNGVPTGAETISASNIQSLVRTLTNDAGQTIESDRYASMGSATYSQSVPQLSGAIYYGTLMAYDGRGRLKRVQAPT